MLGDENRQPRQNDHERQRLAWLRRPAHERLLGLLAASSARSQ